MQGGEELNVEDLASNLDTYKEQLHQVVQILLFSLSRVSHPSTFPEKLGFYDFLHNFRTLDCLFLSFFQALGFYNAKLGFYLFVLDFTFSFGYEVGFFFGSSSPWDLFCFEPLKSSLSLFFSPQFLH